LWNGAAASVVDLNPAGFTRTQANGAAGSYQVGWGLGTAAGNQTHALRWTGTADSVLDLHQYLSGLGLAFTYSQATGIDDGGNIVGYGFANSHNYAILWTPVPEPQTLILLCIGAVGLVKIVRSCRNCD
jgi:hypothetical protein